MYKYRIIGEMSQPESNFEKCFKLNYGNNPIITNQDNLGQIVIQSAYYRVSN